MIIFDCPAAQALALTVACRLHLELVNDTFAAYGVRTDYCGSLDEFAELQEELAVLAYDEVDLEDVQAAEQLRSLWYAVQQEIEDGERSVEWFR